MNYTGDTNEAEHLAGPSPWGSSSPKADRTSFPTSATDVPPSPAPAPQQSPYPSQRGSPNASRYHDVPERSYQQHPDVAHPDNDTGALDSTPPRRNMPPGDAEGGEQPQYPQAQYAGQQQQQQQHQQQRPGAARYQAARQQRPVPQYKLQAKITALERSGRKDPVLRFDVYV